MWLTSDFVYSVVGSTTPSNKILAVNRIVWVITLPKYNHYIIFFWLWRRSFKLVGSRPPPRFSSVLVIKVSAWCWDWLTFHKAFSVFLNTLRSKTAGSPQWHDTCQDPIGPRSLLEYFRPSSRLEFKFNLEGGSLPPLQIILRSNRASATLSNNVSPLWVSTSHRHTTPQLFSKLCAPQGLQLPS
jgi:hypothetical protein